MILKVRSLPANGWFASSLTPVGFISLTCTLIVPLGPLDCKTSPTLTSVGTFSFSTTVTKPLRYSPYPSTGSIFKVFLSPSFKPNIPFSNPGIKLPLPNTVCNGSLPSAKEESNTVPSSNFPV